MHSDATTQGYHTMMITCANGARQYCLAYVMYEEMGKKVSSMELESCIKDAGAMWMNNTKHGVMTECIFAFGYLYQTKNCLALEASWS
eukprot:6198916-Heterocapsa_arctica.AAC.1